MDWELILQELSEASVYAVLMVLAFVLFFAMYKFAVSKMETMMNNAIDTIKDAYKDSNDKLMQYVDRHPRT